MLNFNMSLVPALAKALTLSKKDADAIKQRWYYEDNLQEIFADWDGPEADKPTYPSGLCASIVNKSVKFLFPKDTRFSIANDGLSAVLDDIQESTKLREKLVLIGVEGHVTGTVALKSIPKPTGKTTNKVGKIAKKQGRSKPVVRDEVKWTLDILPIEAYTITTNPLDVEDVLYITIKFRFLDLDNEWKWHQERWYPDQFWEWAPIKADPDVVPEFKEVDAKKTPHPYGQIPITIINHRRQLDSPYGHAEVDDRLMVLHRKLCISESNVDYASQMITNAPVKRVNDMNKAKLSIGPGVVWDVQSDGETEADIDAIHWPDIPKGVFEFQDRTKYRGFEVANVTNPDLERDMKSGGFQSSLAMKVVNAVFIEKIDELRVAYAEDGVEKHLEMLLQIGKLLGFKGYESVNPDDVTTFEITCVFPEFFEQTVEEKTAELLLLQTSDLSEEQVARREARIFGILSEEEVQIIAGNVQKNRDLKIKQAEADTAKALSNPKGPKDPEKSARSKVDPKSPKKKKPREKAK